MAHNTTVQTISPSTGEALEAYVALDGPGLERALATTETAGRSWRAESVHTRLDAFRALATLLRLRREELARLVTLEMGKPIGESLAEIDKCAVLCDYYVATAEEGLGHVDVLTERPSRIVKTPLGCVLGVMPWNFPFWQVLRFAVPTMAAGNTILLKHAPNVTGCSLAIERLMNEAGVPEGVYQALVIPETEVAAAVDLLLSDDRVHALSFTGSDRAGSHVASSAARNLKRSVLELGGSDPFVILADANLADVVDAAVQARFVNAGQSCLAAKRFFVSEELVADFTSAVVDRASALTVGDPLDPRTHIGPMAREDLRDSLAALVDSSVAHGARLLTGGTAPDRPGSWFSPGVITDVEPDSPVLTNETFGPVLAIVAFGDEEEAVAKANHTRYGLGASVWSEDADRATRLGERIQSGTLFINSVVVSDPRLPLGGIKRSGYGRELGPHGLTEFVNLRTVVGAPAASDAP